MERSDTYLNTKELADRWGLSETTLRTWRIRGFGPGYLKIGKKVLYRVDAVLAWENSQTRTSTAGA